MVANMFSSYNDIAVYKSDVKVLCYKSGVLCWESFWNYIFVL